MEDKKLRITIYFEGNVIESNAESVITIGNTYHLKSDEDGQGDTMGLFPCDKVVIIFNRFTK